MGVRPGSLPGNYCLVDLAGLEIDETETHVGGLFAQTTETNPVICTAHTAFV
jgi:hypothetical protein